jgi:hypothetical protein
VVEEEVTIVIFKEDQEVLVEELVEMVLHYHKQEQEILLPLVHHKVILVHFILELVISEVVAVELEEQVPHQV